VLVPPCDKHKPIRIGILLHAIHVTDCNAAGKTKESYIKVFDPAVLEAMRRMQATLEELHRGQQKASRFLPIDGKLLKPSRGKVAERLNAAVC
jgi:hypothetical protein